MSGLDQPLVIANSNYHVGQERSFRVAEEQGFLKEEGLDRYAYERGGLIPGRLEFDGLGEVMWERGVDVATAVDARAAITQRARGHDVYIVGGWRTQLAPMLLGAKGLTRPEELHGVKAAVREKWGLNHLSISRALRTFGVDPERDIEWIEDPIVGYGSAGVGDLLRSGQVQVLPLNEGKEASRLVGEGFPVILDLAEFYTRRGAWPPGKVIVATKQTIEQRGDDLRAFLRANVRAFWFVQDPKNHEFMFGLETRMRDHTYNIDERQLRMLQNAGESTAKDPSGGPRAMGYMAMDGLVPRTALTDVIDDMVQTGELEHRVEVEDVLKDQPSLDAFDNLVSRGLLDRKKIDQWRGAGA